MTFFYSHPYQGESAARHAHVFLWYKSATELDIIYAYDDAGGIPGADLHPDFEGLTLKPVPLCTINLEEMRDRPDYRDVSLFHTLTKFSGGTQVFLDHVNVFAESISSHKPPRLFHELINKNSYIKFLVPYADADFDNIPFTVNLMSGFRLASNRSITPVSTAADFVPLPRIPRLTIAGAETIPANEIASLTVSVDHDYADAPIVVYLESDSGYLPRRKVLVSKEVPAVFPVSAHLLESGDSVTIKAGFRFFNAVAKKGITVV